MMKNLRNMTALILLFSVFMYLACCNDCPSCPQQQPEIVSDYDFYIASHGVDQGIYVYNTKKMEITAFHSLTIDGARDFALSADGTKFLFTYNHTLFILGIPGMDTLETLPLYGYLEVSNSGAYMAVMGDTLKFLDATNFEILFIDTGQAHDGCFLLDDSKFYAIFNENRIKIYDMPGESLYTQIDYTDGDTLFPSLSLIQPSPNGDKIYFKAAYGSIYEQFLISYYPDTDSTGFRYKVGTGLGQMHITPDGSRLMATDPCSSQDIYCTASHTVISIDVINDVLLPVASGLYTVVNHDLITGFDPMSFAITPDSKYALVSGGPYYGVLGLLDIAQHEFIDIMASPQLDSFAVDEVVCQKKLK